MITYVLTVSEFFPKTHNKAGLPTGFIDRISNKTKLHAIRGNYDLWAKRFEKINKGEAVLSVRYWSGKPYNSKQIECFVFDKEDGIGIQKIEFEDYFFDTGWIVRQEQFCDQSVNFVAKNDGLSKEDFKEWFKKYDLSRPMAIIHFTNFRY